MTTRGKTIKTALDHTLTLLRPMITRRYELTVDHDKCCGCEICSTVCPHDSISLSEPVLVDGRLVKARRVDIDENTCSFCGECVVLCPTHALSMTINGKIEIPVLKGEAFPMLIRTVKVDSDSCEACADTAYIDACPVDAISAEIERDAQGTPVAVRNVDVDRGACISCTHCMETGPKRCITVTKPYRGRISLNTALCPEGCQACVDACPTDALTWDGKNAVLDQRFCLYCGACTNVCPAEGALRLARTGFEHTPVESGAWAKAVEELVSYKEVAHEYGLKGQSKRRKAVIDLLLPSESAAGEPGSNGN